MADAGTPLMWAGCFQLLFGNILLGLFEAWLLRINRPGANRSPGFMIAANYASMFVGWGLVWAASPLQKTAGLDPFRYALPIIVVLWVVSFFLTVLVEWWFVARTAGLRIGWRSLATSLWVQAVSYACLVPLVLVVGSISAVTDLRYAEPTEVQTVQGWVYYLSLDRVTVLRTRLDASKTETVARLPQPEGRDFSRITIEPTSNGDRAHLMYREYQKDIELLKNVGAAEQAAPLERRNPNTRLATLGNFSFGPWATRQFRNTPEVYAGYWAREGIDIDHSSLALETPFLALAWRCPIVLPDGKVVAQFGDAIVLVDPKSGRAAKLGEGSGGDVLLDPWPKG